LLFWGILLRWIIATKLARLEEDAARSAMGELQRGGILETDRHEGTLRLRGGGSAGHTYSFVHSTARHLVYEKVRPEKREGLHNLAAMLCLHKYGDEENCQYLAEQFRRANNREQGILYSLRAADIFIEGRKLRSALEAYEGVLKLCNGERVQTEATVRSRMAHVQFLLGDFGEAARLLGSVSEAVDAGKADLSTFDLNVDLARCYGRLGLFGMAESWLDKADSQRLFLQDSTRLRRESQRLFCRAELASFQGDLQRTIVLTREILERADEIEDRALLCRVQLLAADSRFALDDCASALFHCQEGLRVVDSQSAPELVDLALFCLAKYFKFSGKLDRALNQFNLCAHSRRRLELLDDRAEALVEVGAIELFLERPQRALRHLDRASKAYNNTRNAIGLVKTLNLRAEALRQLGRFGQATRLLRASEERQRTLGTAHKSRWESWFVEGRLRLDQGKLREAEADLKRTLRALPQDPRSKLKVLGCRCQFEYQRGNFGEVLSVSQQGFEEARRLENTMRSVSFLEIRALTYQRLGEFQEASSLVEEMREVARSSGLSLREARASMLDGVGSITEGNWNKADECLGHAREVFVAEESERDLAYLNYYSSAYHLRTADFEQCFVELEESLYLAKKLNLYFLKPQLFTALGLFEAKVPEGDPAKAENYLSHAERLAREAGYDDVHWQVVYHLGCVLRRSGDQALAARLFREAATRRNRILRSVPRKFRARYLRFSAGADLADITRALPDEGS
jgi:tetratricopeptide (TPR) repeat protein